MDDLSSYRKVLSCPLALVSSGGRRRPRDLQQRQNALSVKIESCARIRVWMRVDAAAACVRTWGLNRSLCDLLSTLFQFTPLFIQVYREHLTVLTQHVIVCKRPWVWNMHEALLCGNRTEGPEIPELLTGAPGGGLALKVGQKKSHFWSKCINVYKEKEKNPDRLMENSDIRCTCT